MNNAKDFAEIIIAALLCATGGAVLVQALLAIERRRAVPSVGVHEEIDTSDIPPLDDPFFAKPRLRMPRTHARAVTVQIDADLRGSSKAQGIIIAALQRFEEQQRSQARRFS